jgi:phosphate transport system substrate-binding protein
MLNPRQKPIRSIFLSSLALAALTLGLSACGGGTNTTTAGGGGTPAIKPAFEGNVSLTGAGASFPAPLYQNWFVSIAQALPQLQINYQSVGSGAGVEQFIQGTIDFGASDVAITDAEKAKVTRGALALPMTAGSIVIAYNIPGVETGLKLSREAYSGIMAGKITKWNDPAIVKNNPDIKLPDAPITVVHRSDGSGTNAVFTKHLAAISPVFDKVVGQGKSVSWPKTGKFIGARGNEGVTAGIQQNENSIGYVEFGFANNNKLAMAALENKAGKFVSPDGKSESAALAATPLPDNLIVFISDPEGEESYPIVTYSWMLLYKQYDDKNKAIAMEKMIEFGLTTGQQSSAALGYVPLPQNVVERVAKAADQITPDYTINVGTPANQ